MTRPKLEWPCQHKLLPLFTEMPQRLALLPTRLLLRFIPACVEFASPPSLSPPVSPLLSPSPLFHCTPKSSNPACVCVGFLYRPLTL